MDSHCTNRWGVQRGNAPFGSGFPIGASSTPVGTRLSRGKSSVLYLCFRLTPGRGWLRHLRLGQMGGRQTLPGGGKSGGFCTAMDEIRICTAGKIRLTGKGSKGISRPTSRHSDSSLFSLLPPWISHGSYRLFNFPVPVNGQEVKELPLESGTTLDLCGIHG